MASVPGFVPYDLRIDVREVDSAGHRRMALRRFEDSSGVSWRLLLDPHRLETSVGRADHWKGLQTSSGFEGTVWGRLTKAQRQGGWRTGGISQAVNPSQGIVLSVDLCPSRKPFDRRLLRRLFEVFPAGQAIPVSFAVSGEWLRRHGADLAWLQALERSGRIKSTWINHSDHHHFRKGMPARRNFLNLPGTNVEAEILGAESEMLRHGCLPSAFFRFPGLVDDSLLSARVLRTGLLPVGSDAWLAKSQAPRLGSIVLVHGNGNEPAGVREFLKLLEKERPSIRQGHWRLIDLPQGL
ncbi:MAG: hypothetical protein RL318_1263 [Fibrobacterota bacterium]|jgi:hypothetical protein